MKKIFVVPILIFSLFLVACGDKEEIETTRNIGYGTHPYIDPLATEENETTITMADISPTAYDVSVPENVITNVDDIDFDSFEEIDIEDSIFPEGGHDKVLDSGDAQYFFVDDDIKIHAVFFETLTDGKREVFASASYNTETGVIEFYGEDNKTWYFDESGELWCFVLTYSGAKHDIVPVYSFYDAEGNRDVVRSVDGWFTSLAEDALSDDDVMAYIEKYQSVSEATAQY